MHDLHKLVNQHPHYPPVLIFYQGTQDEGEAFFRKVWPGARAVPDIEKTFYNAFDIQRGGLKEMFGPEVWVCGVRATAKGHTIGQKTGDPWVMPGLFLVKGEQILWQHDFKHAGDHPNFLKIVEHIPGNTTQPER